MDDKEVVSLVVLITAVANLITALSNLLGKLQENGSSKKKSRRKNRCR